VFGRSRRCSGDGRVQHRKRLGKRDLHPGRLEDESKFKMIIRPLRFTVMVWYDCLKFHLPLKTSKEKMGLPLKNFMKRKASRLTPPPPQGIP